jgi:hypothetical protein
MGGVADILPARTGEVHCHVHFDRAGALQFVRKVCGYRKPSKVNEEAFERVVEEVARTTHELPGNLKQPARLT